MLQTASRLLPELPLFLVTAVATHLVMSFAQTLMHYKLGHHPIGKRGKSRGSQAVAHRCLMIAGKYGTSGGFGTASREPR